MSISRIRFNKWLYSFCIYKEGVPPEEGKDLNGKWIIMKENTEENQINDTDFIPF